jgi:hypothetical protein
MWSASGFFGVAAVLLALVSFSGGSAAQVRDDAVARELKVELARPQGPDAETGSGSWATHGFDLVTDDFWPLAQDGKSADINVTFDEFLPAAGDADADAEPPSSGREIAADDERDEPSGPVNFPISESVKIKAQPLGGGLGGRVTFTFLLPTGD